MALVGLASVVAHAMELKAWFCVPRASSVPVYHISVSDTVNLVRETAMGKSTWMEIDLRRRTGQWQQH